MDEEKNVPSDDPWPNLVGVFIIPSELFAPNPGDIICVVNEDGVFHRLNGPYDRDQIEQVMTVWANEYLEDGDQFAFWYQPNDDGPPISGKTMVWAEPRLN